MSCEAVLESPYATVRGIPVAAGGVIWSTLVLLIAARGMRRADPDASIAAGYIFVLATAGLSAVLYLGYASFFIIGKVCPLCLTMYVAVIGVFIVSGGAAAALGSLPSHLGRDLKSIVKTPVSAALALIFIAGSVSLLAFFPRAAEQTVTAAGESHTPPTETIEPDQLAEFNRWIDAQPRVNVPVAANGAQVLIVKFNDYECPSCRQTYMEYKGILAKYQNDPKGPLRDDGLSARFRVQRGRRHSRRGMRGGSRRAHGEGEGQGARDGGVPLLQPGKDDADMGQGCGPPGRAGDGLRRAVPESARAGESGRGAGPAARRAGDTDVLHQRHQDQTVGSGRSSSKP